MTAKTSFYNVLNYLPDGVLIVDERGVIVFVNDVFYEMLGYEKPVLLGLNILTLLADIDLFSACIEKVSYEGKTLDVDTDFIHCDGSIIHTVKNVQKILHEEAIRYFVTVRNLASVNLLNRELRRTNEQITSHARELSMRLDAKNQEFEEILGSIDEVIWYIDSQTLTLRYVNDSVESIFGFNKETFLADNTLWQQQIHPSDHALVKTFFETLTPGSSQEIRFRVYRSDTKMRWLSSRIHHHSSLHLFIGITRDITESQKQDTTLN